MGKIRTVLFIQIFVLGFAFLLLYYPVISPMVADWGLNPNYSHGYLIPFVFVGMIYSIRSEIKTSVRNPSIWGLLFIAAGLGTMVLANLGSEFFLQRVSMLVVIFGLVLFLAGKSLALKLGIPILYLIFMIPIPAVVWNLIAFPMQLFASAATEQLLRLTGTPIFREGNILHLPQATLEVANACSGLRSLVSMFALSGAFAFFLKLSLPRKLILFFSAAPIAIIVNILRLFFTAILAMWLGENTAHGFLHDVSGIVVFFTGILMLLGIQVLLLKTEPDKEAFS